MDTATRRLVWSISDLVQQAEGPEETMQTHVEEQSERLHLLVRVAPPVFA